MQGLFFCYTMDSIQRLFFGKEVDTMSGDKDEFASAFDGAHRSLLGYVFDHLR